MTAMATYPRIAREAIPEMRVHAIARHTADRERALHLLAADVVGVFELDRDVQAPGWVRWFHVVDGGDHYLLRQSSICVCVSDPLTFGEAQQALLAVTFGQAR